MEKPDTKHQQAKKRAARARKVREDFAKLLSAHEDSVGEALAALRHEFEALSVNHDKLQREYGKLAECVALLFNMEELSRAHGTEVARRLANFKTGLARAANE
jgi:hypothetical protein